VTASPGRRKERGLRPHPAQFVDHPKGTAVISSRTSRRQVWSGVTERSMRTLIRESAMIVSTLHPPGKAVHITHEHVTGTPVSAATQRTAGDHPAVAALPPARRGALSLNRPPPQLVFAQARDVHVIQRRDDEIGVRGRQEVLVAGSGHT
jgi:hypothetical protein